MVVNGQTHTHMNEQLFTKDSDKIKYVCSNLQLPYHTNTYPWSSLYIKSCHGSPVKVSLAGRMAAWWAAHPAGNIEGYDY